MKGISFIKTYYKTMRIKADGYFHRNTQTEQWDRTESSEISLHM